MPVGLIALTGSAYLAICVSFLFMCVGLYVSVVELK